ncbi:MAG: HTH domain-containing protein [Pseudomonadota bacterium]
MDLFDLMTKGADPEDLALDRLESIVSLFQSDDDAVQDEALARAIGLCGKQWGGYKAGMEALARRREAGADGSVDGALEALRLREEAEDPGMLIRAARVRRAERGREDDERAAVVARYGGLEAALAPTPLERMFIDAAAHLAEGDPPDPWSPLAGWHLPWHEVPPPLRQAIEGACRLPATVTDARDEALTWDARKRDLALLSDGPGEVVLPTACAARHRVVEDLWRRGLAVRDAVEFEARLRYWAERGGDDGTGYAVLLSDLARLASLVPAGRGGGESTKEKARRLRAENPGWSLARIGQELGISRQAVHKHLKGGKP